MNKKLKTTITLLLIVFVAGIIFYPKYKPLLAKKIGGKGINAQPLRQAQQKLNAAGFVITPTHMSELINSTGTLRPAEEVDLSFETSGKIVGINFTEGTRVKKGDLLAKINDRPLQAQLEKLEAQLKMAEAKEFRQRSLLDKDAISQESYDQIQTDVQTIKADINLIKARISETELRAPFDGIIGLRYLSEGSYATSSTKIAKLIKISPIKIEFSIPEKYASEIKIGYPITFTMVGTDQVFNASVYAVDPKIDIETRTIVLRALYPNKNEELKSGRYAGITLQLSQIDNAVSIPTEALIPEMEGEKVFIYKQGKAQSVKVTTGLRTESNIQITRGLNFGDTLITSGIMQLRQNLAIVLDTVIVNKQTGN
ncbi:MAG TPA: efflux RND transporter periplasmic adaptor subunit [Chitinispirillaceae bacterium]|nr:efflux RND transporter periplasmic adaptor subunit [Chitinispirillaceae bacterium]